MRKLCLIPETSEIVHHCLGQAAMRTEARITLLGFQETKTSNKEE